MSKAINAVKCFDDNRLRLSPNPQQDPEKYNLYNGLAALAEAIEAIEAQILELRKSVQRIEDKTS